MNLIIIILFTSRSYIWCNRPQLIRGIVDPIFVIEYKLGQLSVNLKWTLKLYSIEHSLWRIGRKLYWVCMYAFPNIPGDLDCLLATDDCQEPSKIFKSFFNCHILITSILISWTFFSNRIDSFTGLALWVLIRTDEILCH